MFNDKRKDRRRKKEGGWKEEKREKPLVDLLFPGLVSNFYHRLNTT